MADAEVPDESAPALAAVAAPRRLPPLLLTLLLMAALAVAAWAGLGVPLASAWRWLGAAVLAGGLGLMFWAAAHFRRARTTLDPRTPGRASALVSGGPFAIIRNPMYLGMALMLAGWSAVLALPAGALAVAGFVLWIDRRQIPPEEAAMQALFGAEFSAYRARVRRWL